MLAGGYCEAAHGHMGKKERLVRGSKMLSTISHLARQGVGEIGRKNEMCPPLPFTFSTLCSPSPAGCFTMCTSGRADQPSPHHNQLSPSNVIGPHKLSCCPFPTDTLLMACWAY